MINLLLIPPYLPNHFRKDTPIHGEILTEEVKEFAGCIRNRKAPETRRYGRPAGLGGDPGLDLGGSPPGRL